MSQNIHPKLIITAFFILVLGGVTSITSRAQAEENFPQQPAQSSSQVGTAFTYQGSLEDGGQPADGLFDFRFRLYDSVSGGNLREINNLGDVLVNNGLFIVQLDFGPIFGESALWLDISVRPGASTGAYVILSPRQAITSAPMALALPGLHTEPNGTSPNIVGGYSSNFMADGVVGSTIIGGGDSTGFNVITSGSFSFLGGGYDNSIGGEEAFLGGGYSNHASGTGSVLVGGTNNEASGAYSTISGGVNNSAGGYGVVPGGYSNDATGFTSFAAGYRANAVEDGCFVWADVTTADFTCSTTNAFLVRAHGGMKITTESGSQYPGGQVDIVTDSSLGWPNLLIRELSENDYARFRLAGGTNPTTHYWDIAGKQGVLNFYYRGDLQDVMALLPDDATNLLTMRNGARLTNGGAWTNASDANVKTAFDSVNALTILESLAGLPIQSWQYKTEQNQVRHIGPTAQDFYTTFGLGDSDTSITTVDADGIALAAIQGLYQQNQTLQERIAALEAGQSDASKTPLQEWSLILGLGLVNFGFLIGWMLPRSLLGRRAK